MKYAGKTLQQRQQDFINKANEIHKKEYDYSLVEYKNAHTPVTIICPKHGQFQQRPSKHLRENKCPKCSKVDRIIRRCRFKSQKHVFNHANCIHNHKYLYTHLESKYDYITTNDMLTCLCPEHGEFNCTINKHIYQKTGCNRCAVESAVILTRKSREQFINEARLVHGDLYDYSKVDYQGSFVKVEVVCPTHGSFWIAPSNHVNHFQGCCHCKTSAPELIIRQILIDNNEEFEHQKSFIGCVSPKQHPLRFDFFLPKRNLLIEYDGIYHFQPIDHGYGTDDAIDRFNYQQLNDQIKTEFAKENGIRLIRIPYTQMKSLHQIVNECLSHPHNTLGLDSGVQ